MKYSDLISFDPIDTVIQIRDADEPGMAEKLVKTYVMSDDMASAINDRILSQLSLEEVVDNKGVFLVGNYGTGKSHLMSVISAVAQNGGNIKHLKNEKFAEYIKPIAGRFEVLRIEIGAVRTSLRDIITMELEKDLAKRGISYSFPAEDTITSNKDALNDMMGKFEEVYGNKGYLLVIDELLDYLKSRTEMDLMLDLNFLRELGEFIKNSRFRIICGVQESLFDNPAFSFVAATLLKVKDRYEQAIIRREDIAYVVSERILKKNSRQKAWIREHLQKFCNLYSNMSERLEEFVELFPIHPVYIEIFQRVYLAEKREVLKTISATVKDILNTEVPADQPGIKSYDTYWKYIKENLAKKVEPEIKEVLDKSGVLEDIVSRSFTSRAIYKPVALQLIYALSVHRLTTGGLDVRSGLTVQNLKDDLCIHIDTPVKEEEFLTSTVQSVMKSIIETVSGQFIDYNKDNEQYYLNLKKDIDYDAKIEQKASMLHESQLNGYFYSVIYDMLDWDAVEYVPGFKIYEYFINWESKNIFREGYLFMGKPNERSTAQPPRDFYIYFLPPYGVYSDGGDIKDDEVFFKFNGDEGFRNSLKMYAAAREMEITAAQADVKKIYRDKAGAFKKEVSDWINSNMLSSFTVTYRGVTRRMTEVLHGRRFNDKTFKDVIDTSSSVMLSDYFSDKYPKYPKFQVRVTERNIHEVLGRGLDYIAGKQIQDGASLLDSFGLLSAGKIKPENSMYAMNFVRKLSKLPANSVLNARDIFENPYQDVYYDKEFKLGREWIVLIMAVLIYSGHVVLTAANGTRYDASNLDALAKENKSNLYSFKHIARPKAPKMAELKRLFEILGIPEGLIVNPNTWEDAVKELLTVVKDLSSRGLHTISILNDGFALWGQPLIPGNIMDDYKERIRKVTG
ncbi:MAG: exonuclease SbcC, partial [Clostridiales bacterium]|nr:exonuclease SbcC [Clostridiales bacterium]